MSVACDVKEILACVQEMKALIGDQATLEELCQKIEVLEEKLCGPCEEEALEVNPNNVIVDGQPDIVVGDEVELLDENGEVVGENTVTAVIYNAETNQTTLTMQTALTEAQQSATVAVKKKFVAATKIERAAKVETKG